MEFENCPHEDFHTRLNVGYDIDPSGSETQHVDICNTCGAYRFRIDRYQNFSEYKLILGEWHEGETVTDIVNNYEQWYID